MTEDEKREAFHDRIIRWDTKGLAKRLQIEPQRIEDWKAGETPSSLYVDLFLFNVDPKYKDVEE